MINERKFKSPIIRTCAQTLLILSLASCSRPDPISISAESSNQVDQINSAPKPVVFASPSISVKPETSPSSTLQYDVLDVPKQRSIRNAIVKQITDKNVPVYSRQDPGHPLYPGIDQLGIQILEPLYQNPDNKPASVVKTITQMYNLDLDALPNQATFEQVSNQLAKNDQIVPLEIPFDQIEGTPNGVVFLVENTDPKTKDESPYLFWVSTGPSSNDGEHIYLANATGLKRALSTDPKKSSVIKDAHTKFYTFAINQPALKPATPTSLPTQTPIVEIPSVPSVRPTELTILTRIPTLTPTATALPIQSFNQNPRQVGSFFFYWSDCPANNCNVRDMSPAPSTLPINSPVNPNAPEWYKNEFTDMNHAGISIVFPISWGSRHPSFSWFRDKTDIPLMVNAITQNNIPLKMGFFSDTNSESSEWNMDNGRGYIPAHGDPKERQTSPYYMPLSNDHNWSYFYDGKIKPFFSMVPESLWATQNGHSLEDGGKPILMIYSASYFKDLQSAPNMWKEIKSAFKRDFKDKNGKEIDPFIILDYDWLEPTVNPYAGELAPVVNGEYVWGADNPTINRRYTRNNYTTVDLTSGFACPPWTRNISCKPEPRNINYTSKTLGSEGEWLTSQFARYDARTADLLLIESWNELWEGTGIQRSDQYPKNGGGFLPSDFYIRLLRQLVYPN